MQSASGKAGLVLAGGGARAAYQVGVLQALKEMLPDPAANPFPIIAGTSAGAVNAGALACHADDFGRAVDNPLDVWRNFEPRQTFIQLKLGQNDLIGSGGNRTSKSAVLRHPGRIAGRKQLGLLHSHLLT